MTYGQVLLPILRICALSVLCIEPIQGAHTHTQQWTHTAVNTHRAGGSTYAVLQTFDWWENTLTRYKIFAHSFHVKDTPIKTKEELLTLEDNRLSILIISGLCPISCPACFLMMCIYFRARCWCDDNWGNMYVFRLGLFLLITTGEFSYSLYHGAHSNDAT